VLKDATPEPALNEIAGAAADSKSHEADKAGQVSLTQRERVLVWSLPEPMSKQETKDFLKEEKPDAVWAELEAEEEAKA